MTITSIRLIIQIKRALLLILAFNVSSCHQPKPSKDIMIDIILSEAIIECNVFDSICIDPYEVNLLFCIRNRTPNKVLLFGSNSNAFNSSLSQHFGKFFLISGKDTLKLNTHSGYSQIEPNDSVFLIAEVPILISKQLPHKVSIVETLEYVDLEELPIEDDSIRSGDSTETYTTINSFLNKLTPLEFKKELYNFFTESKILYLSHADSYEIDSISEVVFHNYVEVKIRDNFFLEFIIDGKTIEKYFE